MFKVSGKSKKGFTLAEVLITLSIIGVVAALTIPTIAKKHEKQQWIAGYKEAFSIISQATNMVASDNGGDISDAWDFDSTAAMYNTFRPYLKVSKKCEDESVAGKCFPSKAGDLNEQISDVSPYYRGYGVALTNGMTFVFYSNISAYGKTAMITVDTNGQKGPNQTGKDIHEIYIVFPTGFVLPKAGYLKLVPKYAWWDNQFIIDRCPDNLITSDEFINQEPGSTCGVRILRGDYGTAY